MIESVMSCPHCGESAIQLIRIEHYLRRDVGTGVTLVVSTSEQHLAVMKSECSPSEKLDAAKAIFYCHVCEHEHALVFVGIEGATTIHTEFTCGDDVCPFTDLEDSDEFGNHGLPDEDDYA